MLTPKRNTKPFRRNGIADRDVPLAMKAELVDDDAGDPAGICRQRAIAGTPESDQPMQTIPLPTWSPMISGANSPRRRCGGRNSRNCSGIAMDGGTSGATDTGFARHAVLRASARIRPCTDAKHSVARHPSPPYAIQPLDVSQLRNTRFLGVSNQRIAINRPAPLVLFELCFDSNRESFCRSQIATAKKWYRPM